MRTEPLRWSTEELLGEAEWLSRLARKLVGDLAEADDVAQDTWIAALTRRPERATPLRPWLTAVARNFARMRRRSERARDVREGASARGSEHATPDELASRLEAQRALVDALARLREPYRSTVLLAYFEHRTSEEIAQRCSVSASTVRWRLKVAIDELRCELERERPGERGAWMVVIGPLARPSAESSSIPSAALALPGALVMSNLLKIGAAAAAAVVIAAGLMYSGALRSGSSGSTAEAPMAVTFAPIASLEETTPDSSLPTREVAGEPARATDSTETPVSAVAGTAPAVLDARILDEAGNPIAGATLARMSDAQRRESPARSGLDGRARLEVAVDEEVPSIALEAAAVGYATRLERRRIAPGETVHLGDLVLGPGGNVEGRIVDEQRMGVEGVTIALDSSNVPRSEVAERRRFPFRPNGAPQATTRSDGSFTLEGAPAGFVPLAAGRDGWLTTFSSPVEVQAGHTSQGVELVLERVPAGELISGRVIDPEGRPCANAMVAYRCDVPGGESSGLLYADEQGRFELVPLRPIAHDLDAMDPDGNYAGARVESVAAGTHDLVLQLRALRRVALIVRSVDGEPIERFTAVAYEPDGAPTGDATGPGPHEGGRTSLAPPTARFAVHVEAPGYELATKGPFEEDAPDELEFELAPVPSIRGLVLAEGRPVEGARIEAFQRGDSRHEKDGFRIDRDPRALADACSDENGEFSITLRKAGRFVLRASAPGRAACEHELEDYDPRSGLEGLTFELTRGGSIEGRVLAAPGREPAGVIVAFSRGDGFAFTRRAEPNGTYRAEHLIPGRWEVRRVEFELHPDHMGTRDWSGEPWDEVPTNCDVVEGEVTRFDLDLDAGATARAIVEGQLLVDGGPAGAWSVALTLGELAAEHDPVASASLDLEGRFMLQAEETGRAHLIVTAVGGELDGMRLVAPIELAEGSSSWRLDLSTARVRVSNVPSPSRPEDHYGIVWVGPQGAFAVRPLLQTGEMELTIPAGRLKLWRFDPSVVDLEPSLWPAIAEVEVLPGATATLQAP